MRFQLKPGHTNLLIVLKLVACVIFGISCIFIINRFLSYLFPLTPIITYEIINVHYSNPNVDTNVTVGDVFEAERDRVKKKLRFFNIFKKLESLSNLTPETNGRPIQSVVLSTWRTGSEFFSDILKTIPGTFYHFEPLSYMGPVRLRDPSISNESFNIIRNMLQCNYSALGDYVKRGQISHRYNTRLWRICDIQRPLCRKPKFLNSFCRMFPFQIMNLVRLPVEFSETLLADPELNMKIILMVRDPRGTMADRKRIDWCHESEDCRNSTILCQDLESDFHAAQILLKKYPSRFKVFRFDDLYRNPHGVVEEALNFYGLPFHYYAKMFLDSPNENWTPKRESKATAFQWMRKTGITEVKQIQSNCRGAMKLWGYREIENKIDLNSADYNITLMPFPFASSNEQQRN